MAHRVLCWRDRPSAYHLGRVDEALGERSEAIKAYCRNAAIGAAAGGILGATVARRSRQPIRS